jgi:putative Mg2+ transporter-C (MgtC) family protein
MLSAAMVVSRIGISAILGAVLGYERGRHEHPAGLRTHMLVSIAATTFMLVSAHAIQVDSPHFPGVNNSFDPTRIASYVVSGIGFLAGGAILRTGLNVQGLTTASSLWIVTAIGLSAGAGLYTLAIVATVMGYLVLTVLRFVEPKRINHIKRSIRLELDGHPSLSELLAMLTTNQITPTSYDIDISSNPKTTTFTFSTDHLDEGQMADLITLLTSQPSMRRVSSTHIACES